MICISISPADPCSTMSFNNFLQSGGHSSNVLLLHHLSHLFFVGKRTPAGNHNDRHSLKGSGSIKNLVFYGNALKFMTVSGKTNDFSRWMKANIGRKWMVDFATTVYSHYSNYAIDRFYPSFHYCAYSRLMNYWSLFLLLYQPDSKHSFPLLLLYFLAVVSITGNYVTRFDCFLIQYFP